MAVSVLPASTRNLNRDGGRLVHNGGTYVACADISISRLILLFQGNIFLAAESEFEQAQWLEMLQESGKV